MALPSNVTAKKFDTTDGEAAVGQLPRAKVLAKRDRVVDVPKPKRLPPLFVAGRVPTLADRKKLLARKLRAKK